MINTQENQVTKIYLITNCYGDPNKVYIGKTKGNWRKNNHKKTYGSLINYSYIDEINSLYKNDWKPLECKWIQHYKDLGYEVLNKNNGGGGPEFYSEESKQKMRKPHKIHKLRLSQSEETKLKISQANKGKSKPDGFGLILSSILKGKPNIKNSIANKNKKKPLRSLEHIKNLSKPRLNTINMKRPHNIHKITCPYCGKQGNPGPMKRWHFNNCKSTTIKINI